MRTHFYKLLLVFLCSALILTACSSKDDNKAKDGNDTTVTSSPDKSDPGNSSTPVDSDDPAPTQFGEQSIDLVTDTDKLSVYPKEKTNSMYFYNAKDISDETFFPDQSEILGDPYKFAGTILEEYDSITDYLPLNEKHGEELVGLDASSKAFKIMTEYGPVIVIDVIPYQTKACKDELNGDVYALKVNKGWYNDLANYKELPETGDSGIFYGFLYGYSTKDECPVFTYGVAELARARFFDQDYLKFRSDEVKKGKYRNLITYEYPVGWSNVIDDGGTSVILLPGNHGSVSIYDYEDPDMSLDDVIKMFTGEDMQMPDDIPEDEEMMDFNIEDFLKINKKEKTTIGEDNISAYLLDISYKGNDGEWHDESICAVKSKRSVVIMEMNVWDNSTDVSDNTVLNDNTDYAEENDEMLPKDKFKAVLFEELDKVINSIKPCGI